MITIEDLQVRYPNGTLAIDGVSIELKAGEFVAVVGPSGCGKSTLLRAAAGLQAPTAGSINSTSDHMGFVFQDPTLLPWRTVLRNVELIGELRHMGRAARRTRAMEVLSRVGLTEFAGSRPRTLSGGMRMRVSLARTLLTQPQVLLFDEPFGSVDEITRSRLCDDLQHLFVNDKFAALLVTHSISEAVYLASRVLVMSDRPGHIVGEVAVPHEYPRKPLWRFESEFTELTSRVYSLLGVA